MNSGNAVPITVLILVFVAGVIIAVSIAWMEYRKRTRALDVLRIYAERGEEPPASVIQTLTNVSGTPQVRPRTPPTRGGHLSHAAPNAIIAVGLAGLAWGRLSAFGETGAAVVVPSLVALFFAGSRAARLVGAYYAPDR
jgi:hypothetical protein